MNGTETIGFIDNWMWLIFVGFGLFLIILELAIGVETGFDLVFIGSAFILGGLVTWPFDSWVSTLVVTSIVALAYMVIGRRYLHRWMKVEVTKTNVDAFIGKRGIVLKSISRKADGRVKVESEQWKARSDEEISEGDEIVVTKIERNTLIVKKTEGGN